MDRFDRLVVYLVAALSWSVGAGAQVPRPCFVEEPVSGWAAGDLDPTAPGSSRPLPPDRVELCSATTGFTPTVDDYRFLVQRQVGDFVFEAVLESITDRGTAGLVVRWDARTPTAAYVRITAHLREDGLVLLRSVARAANGGPAGELVEPVATSLPVHLRVSRHGGTFVTAYASPGDPVTDHATIDLGGGDLDTNPLVVGLIQASEDRNVAASAIFDTAGFAVDRDAPPEPSACIDGFVTPIAGGGRISLSGNFLDQVRTVEVAGIPARIIVQQRDRLVVETGPGPDRVVHGDVVLGTSRGRVVAPTKVVYAGVPFVRGDLTGDDEVNRDDVVALRAALARRGSVRCREAADVNADGQLDRRDHARLRTFVRSGKRPPAAPFPEPGSPPGGGFACGLPEAPRITALNDDRGRALTPRARLRRGDVVVIEGHGFPSDPARAAVSFGNVATTVLSASSSTRLRVQIAEVVDGGRKCPAVLIDTAATAPRLDRDQAGHPSRLGLAYGVAPKRKRPRLCPRFERSSVLRGGASRFVPGSAAVFLPFPRDTWDPAATISVQVNLYLPLVSGVSRGSRIVRLRHRDAGRAGQSARPPSYEQWLQLLADRLATQVAGAPAGCACDVSVAARADAQGISITPCDPVLSWTDPGLGPDPPHPGPSFPLQPLPQPLSWATWVQGMPSTCALAADPQTSVRKFMWCNFAELIDPDPQSGLPAWEHFIPRDQLFADADDLDPNALSPASKFVMFSPGAALEAHELGYNDPWAMAARVYYCVPSEKDWMPAFSEGQRVIKTFWLAESQLPASADPDDYYSYQPPQGPRQYLAGMHMAVSTGAIVSYFRWSTFFVPKPSGDTTRKDGTALYFNPACAVGSLADRPAEVQGVWQNYVMCTDGAPGEQACGNPWGPPNECHQLSCDQCHRAVGTVPLPGLTPLGKLATAWLPTFVNPDVQAYYELISALNNIPGIDPGLEAVPASCLEP